MKNAAERYASAHLTHYTAKDPRAAIQLYAAMIEAHPDSAEAGYAETQVFNIAKSLTSKQDMLAAYVGLVDAYFSRQAAEASSD